MSHILNITCLVCFFLFGFLFGIHYWHVFIPIQCLSSGIQTRPSFYEHFRYRTIQTCQNRSSKIFLTIAVLSSSERLFIYLPAILHTWGSSTTTEIEIIIFLEEKSSNSEEILEQIFRQLNNNQQIKSCLFIVKLKHVENEYPPQKKSFYAMKFIYTFYQQRTIWLLRLDDNAYVNIDKLVHWLRSIDHRRALYIGQSGSGRSNGPSIHFPSGQYFCMGGSGVILSQQALIELGLWLDQCLTKETLTKHEDVELGRCILTHVRISCSNAYDSKVLFYHHYGPRYEFGYDFTPSIVSQALIIHPIKDQNTFYQIFAFYRREKQHSKNHSSLKLMRNQKYYVTFLSKVEFDLIRDVHYQLIDVRWKVYIEEAVRTYIKQTRLLWHRHSLNWTLTNGQFVFGYHRVISSYGLELIVEVLLNAHSIHQSSTRVVAVRKRFHIRQPFVTTQHLNFREINPLETNDNLYQLNLIVVSSNKDQVLLRFIQNFEHEILSEPSRHAHFTLTILYFSPNNQTNHLVLDLLRLLLIKYTITIRLSVIDQIQTSYNRGLGRHLASKLFTKNQLLFFLDVDIVFTGQALENTRRFMIHQLSVSSCTVYFPIIFSIFSNMFVVDERPIIDVSSDIGLFSIYGFGNVAVRKGDLDKIGGWQTDNQEWGNEDVHLFQRFNSANCQVFRTPEPGLKHYYHEKMCNGIADKIRQKMCHDADAVLLGSQANMVDYVLDKTNFIESL